MSKSSSNSTHSPAASTLDATEKAGEGHPSNLPESENGDYIALPEILKKYYGYWLGGRWAISGEDVYDLGAGGGGMGEHTTLSDEPKPLHVGPYGHTVRGLLAEEHDSGPQILVRPLERNARWYDAEGLTLLRFRKGERGK